MTKTKLSVILLLIAGLLVTGFMVACGNTDDPQETTSKETGEENPSSDSESQGDENMDALFEEGAVYSIKNEQLMAIGGSLFGISGGENAAVRGYAGDLDQLFRFIKTEEGYKIENMSSGLYLAIKQGNKDGSAAILAVEKEAFPNLWKVTKKDGGYALMSISSGCYLAPDDPEVTSTLRQKENAADAAVWQIEKVADGDTVFPKILRLTGDYIDESSCPAIIKANGKYYNYNQVGRIRIKVSDDLINWKKAGIVLSPQKPAWIKNEIGADGVWAPNVWHYKNEYRVYYAGSSSGSQNSVIGLSIGTSPTGPFTDKGMVMRSYKGGDYNCIDPRVFVEDDGTAYLVFGSYWEGIYMRKLDNDTGKLDEKEPTLWHLAKGKSEMEAASIVKKDGYYYLFVAMGGLKKGNYYLAVGRSESLFGPYVDKKGKPMLEGNTSRLTEWKDGVEGAAHGQIFLDDDGTWYFVSEYWRDRTEASPKVTLLITSFIWNEDGWPVTALASDLLREMGVK